MKSDFPFNRTNPTNLYASSTLYLGDVCPIGIVNEFNSPNALFPLIILTVIILTKLFSSDTISIDCIY